MTKAFVRITLKCVDRLVDEDPLPIQVDLQIDVESRASTGKWIKFGIWGGYRDDPDQIWPFLIKEGQIDFGAGDRNDARFGSTDLLQKPIAPGSLVSFTDWTGTEYNYRIATVAVLGEGEV